MQEQDNLQHLTDQDRAELTVMAQEDASPEHQEVVAELARDQNTINRSLGESAVTSAQEDTAAVMNAMAPSAEATVTGRVDKSGVAMLPGEVEDFQSDGNKK